MTYISGFVTPVEAGRRHEYLASAEKSWPLFAEYGAIGMMENWGDKVPEGKQTDFRRSVALKDGEVVVMSWVVWPDKASAERCEASMDSDERWHQLDMPFDGKRMIFGGFETIFSKSAA
jgi:uncharacterized protein YbaA (DUF1428 family)